MRWTIYRLLWPIAWILVRVVYHFRTLGMDKIPRCGAAVLTCNHTSFIDPVLIAVSTTRPIRFVTNDGVYRRFRWFFRAIRAIPISKTGDAEVNDRAFASIDQAIDAGELVMIFPEGALTQDGDVQDFRRGIEAIVGRRSFTPIVPCAIGGLWGSRFSAWRDPNYAWHARVRLVSQGAVPSVWVDKDWLRSKTLEMADIADRME